MPPAKANTKPNPPITPAAPTLRMVGRGLPAGPQGNDQKQKGRQGAGPIKQDLPDVGDLHKSDAEAHA